MTAGERILIERVAAETIICRAIESWAFRQPSIVTDDAEDGPRLLGPLGKGYTSHLGALTRALAALGLRPDKVDRLAPTLDEYLRARAAGNGHAAPEPADADAAAAPVAREESTT